MVRQRPTADSLEALIADAPQLGALPATYQRLSEVVRSPNANAERIAAVVRLDPGLTARLLKLVNSAAVRPSRPIDTVSQAAMRIGTNQLQQLALSTSVVRMFRGMPEHLLDMTSFWTHSIAVALGAHLIGKSVGLRYTETLFISGMLHDVGTLLLCIARPRDARSVLVATENRGEPHTAIEQELLGFDHTDAGAALLSAWDLPEIVVNAARYHHRPSEAPTAQRGAIDIVHIADVVASSLSIGNGGERAAHALDPDAWDRTRLTSEHLQQIVAVLDEQVSSVVEALLG